MTYQIIPTGLYEANCVLLQMSDARTLIVDPGADVAELIDIIDHAELKPCAILLTHGHFDHISGAEALSEKYKLPIYLSAEDRELAFSRFNTSQPGYEGIREVPAYRFILSDGCTIPEWPIGKIISTPGHSPGSICLYIEEEKLLIAGDTLFMSSIGRTDLPGGSYDTILHSLARLCELSEETTVICGHGLNTTIGREKKYNPYIAS